VDNFGFYYTSGAPSAPESILEVTGRPLHVIAEEWERRNMVETSYNGWPASRDPYALGVDQAFAPAGVHFPGGVKSGDCAVVLGYVAMQFHTTVEKLVPGWCWGWEYRPNVNDPNTLSCHASATAVDANAPNHPNGAEGTFTDAQVKRIRAILATAGGVVVWGHDWTRTKDEMHFEIRGSVNDVAAVARRLKAPPPVPIGPRPYPLPAGYYFGPLSGPTESISGMAGDGSDEQYRPAIAAIQRVVHVRQDGLYGPVTINAVRGWQASHRLTADGLTGPLTWRAMQPR
jgi:peptidoglycan hydrolase-like protein with peptidoglycan-binding domain